MKKNEIIKAYGTDYKDMTKRLLSACGIAEELRPDMRIGIKPNLMSPLPAKFGATTHPEVVAGIIEFLQEQGCGKIRICEGSWVGDTTEDSFEYCGYRTLAETCGAELIDTKKTGSHEADACGMSLTVSDCLKDIDYLINVPLLKGHCQTKISCALKNLKGLIPDKEKRRFHANGLHSPIAHLNTVIRPDLIVTDHICGDPDFEDGGNPLVRNCVMVSKDPVLTDSYAASLLGYAPYDIEYIKLAEELGVGSTDLAHAVIKTVEGTEFEALPEEHKMMDISYYAEEVESCSACYSVLVDALRKLKEEGLLEKLPGKVGIGQANRGKTGEIGVGSCTAGFVHNIPGCPPDSDTIYNELKKLCTGK